jgi:hypothetical protein
MDAGRAVDFQVIAPWGPQSLIKRSAIKEPRPGDSDPYQGIPIQTFFRTRPLMARNKVVLIEHADQMNPDAANALLKILEEPPATARLLLTTSELGRVLPTIRSRCLCIACELPEWEGVSPLADTPGTESRMKESLPAYQKLEEMLSSWSFDLSMALGISRELRAWAESLSKSTGLSTRQAHAEAVRCLAVWLSRSGSVNPEAVQAATRAYRSIVQNGSASLTLDGLLSFVCQSREPSTRETQYL